MADAELVPSAHRQPVVAALTAGFWIDVWPRRRALDAGLARTSPPPLSLDTAPSSICRALSRGPDSACRARAPEALDAGAEPLLDRPELDGDRRKVIFWVFQSVPLGIKE